MNENKIIFITKDISHAPNTTPYQRHKLISKTLNGKVFLATTKNDFIKSDDDYVYRSKNNLRQIAAVLLNVIKNKAARNKVVVWSDYEPINLMFAYYIKKILNVEIIADIWDDPKLQIEVNKSCTGFSNKLRQRLRIFLYNLIRNRLWQFDKIIFSIMPEVLKRDFDNYPAILEKSLKSTNGIEKNSIKLISNLEKTKVNEDGTIITYVGVVKEIRGVGTTIDAIDKVHKKLGKFKLVLIGLCEDKDKDWLLKKVKNMPWKENIILKGYIPFNETAKQIKSSDILVYPFPRKNELDFIYPIKIFEYLAANNKIVSSDLLGVKSILKHFKGVYFFNPERINDFSEKLVIAAKDKRKFDNVPFLEKEFTWEKINGEVIKYVSNI